MITVTFAATFLLLGISVLIYASRFEYTATDPLGPMFFPEMLASFLILLSLIVIMQRIKASHLKEKIHYSVYVVPVLSIIYVITLFNIGFLFSTIVFVLLIIPFFNQIEHFSPLTYRQALKNSLRESSTYKLLIFLILLVWGLFIQILHIPLPLYPLFP